MATIAIYYYILLYITIYYQIIANNAKIILNITFYIFF
jgi:hypothetical protein